MSIIGGIKKQFIFSIRKYWGLSVNASNKIRWIKNYVAHGFSDSLLDTDGTPIIKVIFSSSVKGVLLGYRIEPHKNINGHYVYDGQALDIQDSDFSEMFQLVGDYSQNLVLKEAHLRTAPKPRPQNIWNFGVPQNGGCGPHHLLKIIAHDADKNTITSDEFVCICESKDRKWAAENLIVKTFSNVNTFAHDYRRTLMKTTIKTH